MTPESPTRGTLFSRPDGALYFIPDEELERYRLSATESAQMRERLVQEEDVQGYSMVLPALIEPLGTVVARTPVAARALVLCTAA